MRRGVCCNYRSMLGAHYRGYDAKAHASGGADEWFVVQEKCLVCLVYNEMRCCAVLMVVWCAGGAWVLSLRAAHPGHVVADCGHSRSAAPRLSLAPPLDVADHPQEMRTSSGAYRPHSSKYNTPKVVYLRHNNLSIPTRFLLLTYQQEIAPNLPQH